MKRQNAVFFNRDKGGKGKGYFKRSRRMVLCLLCGLFAFALFAAASGCGSSYIDERTPLPTIPFDVTPAPEQNSGIIVQPAAGGGVSMGVSGLDTLNPLKTNNEDIKCYMSLVFDSLIRLDHSQAAAEELAVGWETADGGRTWDFTLREGVKWHDGTVFHAADVTATVSWLIQNGGSYGPCVAGVLSCTATSEYSVRFTLSQPDAFLPCKLYFPILKGGTADDRAPVGTGMYRYLDHSESCIRFERNTDYWSDLPYIDTIALLQFANEREKNESDADLFVFREESVAQYAQKAGYQSYKYADRGFVCLVPNLTAKNSGDPIYDLNVRKALSYCFDSSGAVNIGASGWGTAAKWPVFSGTYYWRERGSVYEKDEEQVFYYLGLAGYQKDPATGYWYKTGDTAKKNRLTVTCLISAADMEMAYLSNYLKQQLAEFGIVLSVTTIDGGQFETALNSRNYSIAAVKLNVGFWPDFYAVFGSRGSLNFCGYTNSRLDTLSNALYLAYEGSDFTDFSAYCEPITTQIRQILEDELPMFGLYFRSGAVTAADQIKGIDLVCAWDPLGDFSKWHIYTVGTQSTEAPAP